MKDCFDPQNLLNPGKKARAAKDSMLQNLRCEPQPAEADGERSAPPRLLWSVGELEALAFKCNGCGSCLGADPGTRMCPAFRRHRLEEASPRAKANLIRRLLLERQPDAAFADPETLRILDYCLGCRQCALECPSAVNIPRLVAEAKARHFRGRKPPVGERFFANL